MTINLENWTLETIPTILILVFFPIFIYFTYWLFITGIIGALRMLKSKNWKHTIGKVIDSEIRFMKFGGGSDEAVSFKFILKKTYTYSVNNKTYESNQTLVSDSLYQKEFKPMSKFPKEYGDYKTNQNYLDTEIYLENLIGKPVTVYYNPKKPQKACLENRFKNEIFLPIFMGLLFGGALTYFAYYTFKLLIE